jgi:hypothetical protein
MSIDEHFKINDSIKVSSHVQILQYIMFIAVYSNGLNLTPRLSKIFELRCGIPNCAKLGDSNAQLLTIGPFICSTISLV